MQLITRGKTNWKFLIIIAILAAIVIGILAWNYLCAPEEKIKTVYIKIDFPNGGEQLIVGKTYDIVWESQKVDRLHIYLVKEGASDVAEIIAGDFFQTSTSKYSWTIPTNNNDINLGGRFKIIIGSIENRNIKDESDNYFSIIKNETSDLFSTTSVTDDWKIYGNEEYEFEIKYPNTWFETHLYDKNIVEFQNTDKKLYINTGGPCSDCTNEKGARIEFFIKENPQKLSVEDFVNKTFDWYVENNEIEINQKEIAGTDSLEVKTKTDFGAGWPHIYIPKNDKIFIINYSQTSPVQEQNLEIFNQMLSTFRFIK